MSKKVLFITIIGVLSVGLAFAGGLNRIGGMGARHGGTSGTIADDTSLFCYNPAGLVDFQERFFDLTAEAIWPKFVIKNRLGSQESEGGVFYPLPMAGAVWPINQELSLGIGVTTPYGLGAKFESAPLKGIFESETLITETNITPAAAFRISEKLSLGVGLNLGYCMFKYLAPFDVREVYLPIKTDSEADGWGLGAIVGLQYRPNEKLNLNFAYLTESKNYLSGDTKISGPLGLLSFRDDFESEFTFPPRLGMNLSYQVSSRLQLGFSAHWYGYSKTAEKIVLDFKNLPLRKTKILNWRDNYSLHFGGRRQLKENWHLNAGIGYQTAAIPPERINQLTPDATGWDVSLGLSHCRNNRTINAEIIYGFGDSLMPGGTMEAETITAGLSFNWLF